MSSISSVNSDNIAYLNGLRGWAALAVAVHHFLVAFYPALISGNPAEVHTKDAIECYIATSPLNVLYNGNYFVCIFFVLSGFVLSYKFFKYKNLEMLQSIAIKRYFRLAIPVFFSVVFAYLLVMFSLFFNQQAADITLSSWWLKIFWNEAPQPILQIIRIAFVEVFLDSNCYYNTCFWTMQIELFGSFMVFAFLALFSVSQNRYIIYGILTFVLLHYKQVYLAGILGGVVLCDLFVNKPAFYKYLSSKSWLLLILGIFFGSYPSASGNPLYLAMHFEAFSAMSFYHVIGALLTLAAILTNPFLMKVLSSRISQTLGTWSFSMYLIHVPIIGSLCSYLFLKFQFVGSYHLTTFMVFVIYIFILFILSRYATLYIDRKAIDISNIIYNRIFKKAATPSKIEI